MAENGVIAWLARQLSHLDTMPLSGLECCGALLMNLAMARAGRHECQQVIACTHFACPQHAAESAESISNHYNNTLPAQNSVGQLATLPV